MIDIVLIYFPEYIFYYIARLGAYTEQIIFMFFWLYKEFKM